MTATKLGLILSLTSLLDDAPEPTPPTSENELDALLTELLTATDADLYPDDALLDSDFDDDR